MTVTIKDTDKGFDALFRRLKEATKDRSVKVGILEGTGGSTASGMSVLEVATIHEFGLGNHPERSFIRAFADQDKNKILGKERKLAESVIKGTNTVDSALEKLGVVLQADAQGFIQSGRVSPPTAKDGTTLIDTGQLVTSISHEVE